MEYQYISSRTNDTIKHYTKLLSSKRQRDAEGVFVCEGLRLCRDALESGFRVKEMFFTREALDRHFSDFESLLSGNERLFVITDELAKKMSDTVSSQGIFTVCERKEAEAPALRKGKRYVCLENLQNPQNLGTVARTAEALGISAVIVLSGCDIYNPKALRASMGSLLRIPIIRLDSVEQAVLSAKNAGLLCFASVPDSEAESITSLDFSCGAMAIIGNEGNGVSLLSKQLADRLVTIKMKGQAESLNAAAAADIIMWEMMR